MESCRAFGGALFVVVSCAMDLGLTASLTHCLQLILYAIALLLLIHWPMGWFLYWLRTESGIEGERSVEEVGVPPEIVGPFERLLAFFLMLFDVTGAAAVLAAWLAGKLAASWKRYPVDQKDPTPGRGVRAGTMSALIAGVVSVSIGVLVGLAVRCECG